MHFNFGDIISTFIILLIFITMFFVMIKIIKQVKSTPLPLPPEALQQQVEELAIRVKQLESQVKELSKKR